MLKEVPIDQLKPLITFPQADPCIVQLHHLVQQFGILRPIICTEQYFIVDGNKLYTVLKLLSHQTAPVWIIETPNNKPYLEHELWNLYSILNSKLPLSYRNAVDPLLDTLRLELTSTIINMLPALEEGIE